MPDLDESKHSIELARGGENLPQKVVNFGQLFNELGVQTFQKIGICMVAGAVLPDCVSFSAHALTSTNKSCSKMVGSHRQDSNPQPLDPKALRI
ncbi:MAG: hypothetical protein ACK2UW_05900, partial [Anaerolineales bacterium]